MRLLSKAFTAPLKIIYTQIEDHNFKTRSYSLVKTVIVTIIQLNSRNKGSLISTFVSPLFVEYCTSQTEFSRGRVDQFSVLMVVIKNLLRPLRSWHLHVQS